MNSLNYLYPIRCYLLVVIIPEHTELRHGLRHALWVLLKCLLDVRRGLKRVLGVRNARQHAGRGFKIARVYRQDSLKLRAGNL